MCTHILVQKLAREFRVEFLPLVIVPAAHIFEALCEEHSMVSTNGMPFVVCCMCNELCRITRQIVGNAPEGSDGGCMREQNGEVALEGVEYQVWVRIILACGGSGARAHLKFAMVNPVVQSMQILRLEGMV